MIISLQNQKIKNLVKLRNSSVRKERGVVIVEGTRECRSALTAKLSITEMYYCTEQCGDEARALVEEIIASGLSVEQVSSPVYTKIAFGNRSEGILLIAEEPTRSLDSITLSAKPLILIVDSVEKPGNLGAIIRTANAAGIDAVITTGSCVDTYNHNVIRASLGSVFTTTVIASTNAELLAWLQKNGMRIVTAHPDSTTSYFLEALTSPTAIIIGREDTGVSDFWINNADQKVTIPMTGTVNSLNASVSAALLMYEAIRQRQQLRE